MPSKEKPILRVPQATPKAAPAAPVVPVAPTKPAKPNTVATATTTPAPTVAPPATKPTHASQSKPAPKKRRFTERRIGITVRSLKNTRKARKSIRKQVAAMSTAEIRKVLTEKGVIKASSNPPESMLRSLMKDYLSLKH
jgi:hypothetical protein